MALHVIYRFKAGKTIYRMVYHTYILYRFLGYKSICTIYFAKKLVCHRVIPRCNAFLYASRSCNLSNLFRFPGQNFALISEKCNTRHSALWSPSIKLNVLLTVHHSISWPCITVYQYNETKGMHFYSIYWESRLLHVSSTTCSFSGGAPQTPFGILRAYVSWLRHGCSGAVKMQPCRSQLT
jgi:hypothetical protein